MNIRSPGKVLSSLTALFFAAILMQNVSADDQGNADIVTGIGCMEDESGISLNCTANDISLANATNIDILDDGCAFIGDTVTFTADFEVLLTAQNRHDIGIWFAEDGDPNGDGALSGACTAASPPFGPAPTWTDIDTPLGEADQCGDITNDNNPLFPSIELTVTCVDPDGNNTLNLPNCTSWRQPGANEICNSAQDAFPGAPSKCKCDDGFELDINVPSPTYSVTKLVVDGNGVEVPGDTTSFQIDFTPSGAGGADPGQHSLTSGTMGTGEAALGDYSITETISNPDYSVVDWSCTTTRFDGTTSTATSTTASIDVTLAGGDQSLDCVVTNELLFVEDPQILIEKSPETQTILSGETASFDLAVTTGTGNVPISNVTVTDAQCTTGPTFVDGDTNGDGVLDLDETWNYTCEVVNVTAGFTNTATVDGESPAGTPVDSEDTAEVTVLTPGLGILKELTAGNNPAAEGDVLSYTITATNTGTADLTSVVVSDNTITPSSTTCATVVPGGTCVLTGDYTVQASDVANGSVVNVATADSNETDPVDDTVTVPTAGTPGLAIDKALTSGPNPATLGAILTYQVTASNTGNTTLTNVVVTDNTITPNTTTCATVAIGATCVLTGTYQVTQADITAGSILNTATADSDETPEVETDLTVPTEIGTGKIGNLLWNDFNNNGIRDAGEPGLPGQTVELYDCSGNLLLTETTNGDGSYFFRDLPLGSYQVRVLPISGATLSPANAGGDDEADSDFDQITGLSPCTTLTTADEWNLTVDAGFHFGDGPPTVSVGDLTVNEDDGTANVTVFLSAPAAGDVTVRAFTQNISAMGGTDYFGFGGQSAINPIVIPAGQTSVTVPVTIIDDLIEDEPNRTFRLRIEAVPGTPVGAVIADPIGIVTIVDNDTDGGNNGNCVPNPEISILDVTANEIDLGGSAVIMLDQCSTEDVNVRVFTNIGSAQPPSAGGPDPDYFGFTQNITIPAGDTSGTVSFTLINDDIAEPLETFNLRMLCNASCGGTIVDGTAVVSINDDDDGGNGGFEACPADHWKQSGNFSDWPLNTQVNGEFLRMGKPFLNVFGVTYANPDLDLLKSLRRTGGGNQALMREGVAAMLNAASTSVNYPLSINDVLTAVANGDTATLSQANNGGTCPL